MGVWAEIVFNRVSRVFESDTVPIMGPPCMALDVAGVEPPPTVGWVLVRGVLMPEPPPEPASEVPVLVIARPEVTGPADLLSRGRVERDSRGWDCTVPVGCSVRAGVRVELDGGLLDGLDGRPAFTNRYRVPWVPVGLDDRPAGPPVYGDLEITAGCATAIFAPPAPLGYLLDQAGIQSRLQEGELLRLPDVIRVVGLQ